MTDAEEIAILKDQIDVCTERIDSLLNEKMELVKQINELKPLCTNRGAFIDWCNEHHQEIVDEYLGF